MATVTTLPARLTASAKAQPRQLSDSMDKVRDELEKVRSKPDVDSVHDLRVALRRCRSVATVFEEIDPDDSWPEMRRKAKKLFRALGGLRDAHVMDDWVKKLAAEDDAVRMHIHSLSKSDEPELGNEVAKAAGKFDDRAWKSLRQRYQERESQFLFGWRAITSWWAGAASRRSHPRSFSLTQGWQERVSNWRSR